MGFTLIELLVAAAIGLITTSVAGNVLIDQMKSSQRIEALQRQRDNWTRATDFISSEINLSERVYGRPANDADPIPVTIPSECNLSDTEFRLAVELPDRNFDPIIYGVKPSESNWLGDNSLYRCGPDIAEDGTYTNTLTSSQIIDSLDEQRPGNGFNATVSGLKKADFALTLKGLINPTYSQTDTARSRVRQVYGRPSDNSICDLNGPAHFRGTTAVDSIPSASTLGGGNSDLLLCGGGGSESLTGGNFNDVIESGDAGEAVITGGAGNDFLRGSNSNNTIFGGDGDDVLIARGGNDLLLGGSGSNQYLTGIDEGSALHDTVQGGTGGDEGTDVVYFKEDQSSYSLSTSCTTCSCVVERTSTRKATINLGETLIFADSRKDLPEQTSCPTPAPSPSPAPTPTPAPTPAPTPGPTPAPSPAPTPAPTPAPSDELTDVSQCATEYTSVFDRAKKIRCENCFNNPFGAGTWNTTSESCSQ